MQILGETIIGQRCVRGEAGEVFALAAAWRPPDPRLWCQHIG
jgi:alpha-ketoglutaric semialdehyde dehydrogenase